MGVDASDRGRHEERAGSGRPGWWPWLFLLAGLWCASAQALDPGLALSQLNRKSWLTRDGAPVGIAAIAQGTDGTLWIASRTGLFRFNGLKFSKYGDAGEPALQSENIISATATRDGSLWISPLFGGLDRLHGGRVTHYPPGQELPRGTVRSVAEDGNGVVWAAANGGVARRVGGRWERLGADWNLPAGPATDVAVGAQGDVWIRTLSGIYQLPSGQRQFREVMRYKVSDIGRQALIAGRDGSIWHFSTDTQLHRVAPGGVPVPVPRSDHAGAGRMMIDRDGLMWLGGTNGLQRLRPRVDPQDGAVRLEAPEALDALGGLSASYVACIFEDREGNVWVSTTGGLDRFSNTDLVRVATPFTEDYLALSPGAGGEMFVGGQSAGFKAGLARLRGGAVERQWPGATVNASFRAADGSNWFAGIGTLSRISGDDQQVWPMPPELATRPPQAMVQDGSGAMWVSIGGMGLYRFTNEAWSPVKLDGLLSGTAIAANRDGRGRLWFGFPGGVSVVDGDAVRSLTKDDGLDIGPVTAIHGTGERVWLGGERGIVRMEGLRPVPLETTQHRLLTGIAGMAEDALGGLWAATYSSVAHVPADELRRALADPAYKVRAQVYDYLDGMPGVPRQLRPTPSLVAAGDGKIWVATDSAVFYIDPKRLHAAVEPPPVALRSLRSDDRVVRLPAATSTLAVGATSLEIDYESWSLKAPERVHFRYRLEGADDDWQEAGTRRTAYYSRLGPGRYPFRVEARVADGTWSTTPASLSFVVPPAWYQTLGFRLLCGLAVLAALWLLYRWRVAKVSAAVARLVRTRLEERLSERERIARELHDTLLQSIQGLILSFQGVSLQMPDGNPVRQQMETTLDRAEEVLGEARDRVRDLRTAGQDDIELSTALQSASDDIGAAHAVTCTTRCSGEPVPLDRTVRDEVYRVAREAVLNAFEHARARRIEVDVRYERQGLVVTVTDDGIGIDEQVMACGARVGHWGLPGMRERAERIAGEFELTSSAQGGTRVRVSVPAGVAYRPPERAPEPLATGGWRRWGGFRRAARAATPVRSG